ncbi:hypothetical protein BX666DRAFT_1930369 [Dichotomocladium elegans]|nr:hypothetical protein BX666DRAFT_1930369 [Dichotomocladium elegans]
MNAEALLGEPYQLNALEIYWETMYKGRNPMLVTGVLAFAVHELIYFGRFLPYLICDHIPYLRQYKLQPHKHNSHIDYWRCTKRVLYCHFVIESPIIFFFHPSATLLGMRITAPFPCWYQVLSQLIIFFVLEDFYHYHVHRLMHSPFLYRNIHRIHHEYAAPFGIAAEYAHPIETILLGFGTIAGPLAYHLLAVHFFQWGTGWHLHMTTMLWWIVLRLHQTVDAHSGYDFPWSLRHFLPFWTGADHHDYHHQAFVGNYGSSFRWWDYLFGTDAKYRAYRKQQRRARGYLS